MPFDHAAASLRVLLVDEDPAAAEVFRSALRRAYGERASLAHFVKCSEARAVLIAENASGIDIAFIGCRDGGDGGLGLVRAVRDRHPLLPLVVLTAVPSGADTGRALDDADIAALRAGADDSIDRSALDAATLARVTRYALERARSNRRLLESEGRYRALFEAHPLPLWLYDPATLRIVDVNPAASEKYGLSREQFIGLDLRSLRAPEEVPKLEETLADASAIRKTGPWRHRRASGEEILVDTYGRPVEIDGRKLRIVAPIDRTTEYRAVEALRHANEALERRVAERTAQLEASERRYRTLAELAPQVVWSADASGALTYLNRAWYAIVGGEPADWLGHGWFRAVHPDDLEGVRQAFFAARANREPMQGKRRIRARDGGWRTTLIFAAPVIDDSGRIEQWIGVDTDITELERGRELIEQSNADLEAFSYTVSHDLRAPLHVIQGFTEALLNGEVGSIDATAREYLERVVVNTRRMGQLIQDILRLSRVTREPLDRGEFDIAQLARDTMAQLREGLGGRGVEFEAPEHFLVRADRRLIGIALQNLLDNALKFSSREAVSRIVFTARRLDDGCAEFELSDNGVGFPVAWRDPGFGMFQRLHGPSEFPGNGIGLATVARIIRRHGGRLEAGRASDRGATFRFTLDCRA